MGTNRAAVHAAMITAVEHAGAGYVSKQSALWDSERQTGCIQGQVLVNLGLLSTDRVTSGSTPQVMERLGLVGEDYDDLTDPYHYADPILGDALSVAEQVNDSRLPWGLALELFELVLGGRMNREQAGEAVYQIIRNIDAMKDAYKIRTRPAPSPLRMAYSQPSPLSGWLSDEVDRITQHALEERAAYEQQMALLESQAILGQYKAPMFFQTASSNAVFPVPAGV